MVLFLIIESQSYTHLLHILLIWGNVTTVGKGAGFLPSNLQTCMTVTRREHCLYPRGTTVGQKFWRDRIPDNLGCMAQILTRVMVTCQIFPKNKVSRSFAAGKLYPDVEARYWSWIFFKFLEAPRFLAGRGGGPGWWVWVASVYHILWELSRFLLPGGHTWVVPVLKELRWSFSQVWGLGLSSLSSNVLTYSLRLTACGAGQSGKKKNRT